MQQPKIMPRGSKYGSNYWISEGPKVGMRQVTFYSDLEFDHWVYVETEPEVEKYCEQYPEISYVLNGELHSSVFDMWIQFRDGSIKCCEIKYESELTIENPQYERTLRQTEAQRAYCEQNGIHYEIVTDKHLRQNPYELENRLNIISFVKNNPEPSATAQLRKYIRNERKSMQVITDLTSIPYPLVHNACLWLYYHGVIQLNLDESIVCRKTEVWLREPC